MKKQKILVMLRRGETNDIDCQEMRMISFEGGDETHLSGAGLAGGSLPEPLGL